MSRNSLIVGVAAVLLVSAVWLLHSDRVTVFAQGPMPVAGGGNWELRIKRIGVDQIDAVRFDRVSGEGWQMVGDEWKKIGESAPVPKGSYDVQIAAEEADTGIFVYRIDRITGKTWKRQKLQWFAHTEAQ